MPMTKEDFVCSGCGVQHGHLHEEGCPVMKVHLDQINGVDTQAKRYNKDKCPHRLVPIDVLNEIAWQFGFGAEKYGEDDWKKGQPSKQLYECATRHLGKYMAGMTIDPESKLHHLAAACVNIMMLMWHDWHTYPHNNELDKRERNRINKGTFDTPSSRYDDEQF